MSKSPAIVEAKSVDGQPFARLYSLASGGNVAMCVTQNEKGEPEAMLFMLSRGFQSVTRLGTGVDPRTLRALMMATTLEKVEEIQASLDATLAKSAPQLVALQETLKMMADFGGRQAPPTQVATIRQCEGQDFLVVRSELSAPGDRPAMASISALRVFGATVNDVFRFGSSDARDSAFKDPNVLQGLLSSLAMRQSGQAVIAEAIQDAPRRPKPGRGP
jgi:hypothetical protein